MSLESAKKTALDAIKGSITKVELDDEEGQLVGSPTYIGCFLSIV
ncbi:PepSY domain-containing protein [Neobacillus sp. GCM10023253]